MLFDHQEAHSPSAARWKQERGDQPGGDVVEWIQTVFQNGPEVIKAASQSGLGIIALCLLVIGCAGVFYLARARTSSPWVGFAVFLVMVLGALSLSVVGLYAGAKQTLDLANAKTITFKTPYYNEATKTYRLLDATVTNIGKGDWRELQERPDGNAQYYYVVKSVEPGRILFGRKPPANGQPDTTELIADLPQRLLCYRGSPDDSNLQCPYALVAIE